MHSILNDDLLFLLHDIARIMRVRTDQHARATGMTRAQWVLLALLERQPGMTQNELAGLVEVEPITVGRLVDRLEARGVVERRHDTADRRVRRLHLTTAAAPLLDIIHRYRMEFNELLLDGVSCEQAANLRSGLASIKQNLLGEKHDRAEAR